MKGQILSITITTSGEGEGRGVSLLNLFQGGDIQNLELVIDRVEKGRALSLAEGFLATQVPPQGPHAD